MTLWGKTQMNALMYSCAEAEKNSIFLSCHWGSGPEKPAIQLLVCAVYLFLFWLEWGKEEFFLGNVCGFFLRNSKTLSFLTYSNWNVKWEHGWLVTHCAERPPALLYPLAFPAVELLCQSSTTDQDIDNDIILLNHNPYYRASPDHWLRLR